MNTEKLIPYIGPGVPVKNFRELCRILGVQEPRNGQERIKLEAKLKQYIDFRKHEDNSNQLIILEIYQSPLPEPAMPMHKNSKYLKYIQPILLNSLVSKDGEGSYSTSVLYNLLGMVNKNYFNTEDYFETRKLDYDTWYVQKFYCLCDSLFSGRIRSALKSMANKNLITYSKPWYVKDNNYSLRLATPEDEKNIVNAKQEVLDEMGLIKEPIYNRKLYYKKFDAKIWRLYKWQRAFTMYDIKLIKDMNIISEADIIEYRYLLNRATLESIIIQAENEYKKNLINVEKKRIASLNPIDIFGKPKTYTFAERTSVDDVYIYPADYCDTIKKLSKHFLLSYELTELYYSLEEKETHGNSA